MADLLKLIREMAKDNPELQQMFDEDDKYKAERKQFHLSNGCDEKTATINMWNDFWKKANDEHGVTFSIHELQSDEVDEDE